MATKKTTTKKTTTKKTEHKAFTKAQAQTLMSHEIIWNDKGGKKYNRKTEKGRKNLANLSVKYNHATEQGQKNLRALAKRLNVKL